MVRVRAAIADECYVLFGFAPGRWRPRAIAMSQVRAEYDFEAQPNSGEMSITSGEILTVIRNNIEGGWVEGKNSRGSVGLFPASYVIPHFGAPPSSPPPPPPPSSLPPLPTANVPAAVPSRSAAADDWGTSTFLSGPPSVAPSYGINAPPAAPPSQSGGTSQYADDFDDEWTDEEEPEQEDHRLTVNPECMRSSSSHGRATSGSRTDISTDDDGPEYNERIDRRSPSSGREQRSRKGSSERDRHRRTSRSSHAIRSLKENHGTGGSSMYRNDSKSINRSQSVGDRTGGKANRNINRFSNFVKSGMEAYVLGDTKMSGHPGERHEIINHGTLVQYRPIQQYYTCTVDKPKKESKMKGLKSFIAYSITSSLRGIQVSRRYKHFDWLHERLSAKYAFIPIPPLPEKTVAGRYEDDLIDHRKHILQLWVNKICRHPILSQSEVWLHFISCTDEREWKNGKRKAERDEYVGGNFLHCITFPASALDNAMVDRQVDKFQKSVKITEDAMRVMSERVQVFQKLYQGPVKANWQKMALAFANLGQSFQTDDQPGTKKMVDALQRTVHQYHAIGNEFEAHARNDMEPVVENLYSFKGTVEGVPNILQVHKQCVQKLRENEMKVSASDAERIRQRVDTTSYAVLAEMSHLNTEKIEDLRHTMGTYLRKQAEFYQKLANNMNELAAQYDF